MSNTSSAENPEPSRTLEGLLARSLQARLAAVARQSVALGLIGGGAATFTRISTGDVADGFPVGSDYGVLYAQDDLSPEQSEAISQRAASDVRAEAERLMHDASPELAAVIAEELADWQEGREIEQANQVLLREQDRDEDEMRRKAAAPGPVSPGRQYVAAYLLQEAGNDADTGWIAECIDDGRLIACPRCHFLHLPLRPFPLSRKAQETAPADACDVCAAVPVLCDPINWGEGWEKALACAGEDVAYGRTQRAITLYRFWIEATNGADALRVAAIADALAGLAEKIRMQSTADAMQGGE